MKNVRLILSLVLMASGSAFAIEQSQDQEIVDQFFPLKLSTRKKFADMIHKQSEFITADLDKTGKEDYIVAAYSNGSSGALQVLKRSNGTAGVADLKAYKYMQGGMPELILRDLDGDGRPEIIVKFRSVRNNTSDWVFRWDGQSLNVIGPTSTDEKGEIETLIGNSKVIDLYGDGRLYIVDGPDQGFTPPEDPNFRAPQVHSIYALQNGKFVRSESFIYSDVFKRNSGSPVEESRTFSVDRTNVKYIFKIINGGSGKDSRVSSAEVRLNGQIIAGPNNFSQDQGAISAKVVLAKSNELKVILKSAPNSFIRVLVEPTKESL